MNYEDLLLEKEIIVGDEIDSIIQEGRLNNKNTDDKKVGRPKRKKAAENPPDHRVI